MAPGGLIKPSVLGFWPVCVTFTQMAGAAPAESSLDTRATPLAPPRKPPGAAESRGPQKTMGPIAIKG